MIVYIQKVQIKQTLSFFPIIDITGKKKRLALEFSLVIANLKSMIRVFSLKYLVVNLYR